MHLGIDLGTTRTIVASVDRGNYPVVSFIDDDGDAHDHVPSLVAEVDGELRHGLDAVAAAATGAPVLRSFKRVLAAPDVTGTTPVRVGSLEVPVLDLLTGYLSALHASIYSRSNLPRTSRGPRAQQEARTVVAVPAHAHGAQRYLTLEAFRRAGFQVTAMLNEPSAAGFEYTHHRGDTISARRNRVIVYDLGGGTFDASLVSVTGTSHAVLGTAGINRLGGDDFDDVLLGCVHAAAGTTPAQLTPDEDAWLREQVQDTKERLSPQSRRMTFEVGAADVTVPVEDFYAAATPLVESTMDAMAPLVGGLDAAPDLTDIAGIYLVGGGSALPLVPRLLRSRFGRRVHRSPHPAASTAIGLAIAADEASGFELADRLSRGFGVFRERDSGRAVSFDPILRPDTAVSTTDDVVLTRRYRAAHNVGWFRFVECSAIDHDGGPQGDIVPFADVVFAFDPALRARGDLTDQPVERRPDGPLVEETYTIDPHGIVEVTITDLDTDYSRTFRIQG